MRLSAGKSGFQDRGGPVRTGLLPLFPPSPLSPLTSSSLTSPSPPFVHTSRPVLGSKNGLARYPVYIPHTSAGWWLAAAAHARTDVSPAMAAGTSLRRQPHAQGPDGQRLSTNDGL
ncbi:hypothetical protein LZ32DRAFT_131972 [Colletotrichum eremochloae]|nr:hypothetical protein LZ32DRAFT_131972 [Colletotrichum eremochloae]